MNFSKYIVAHALSKFKYFAKQIIFSNSPARKLQNGVSLFYFLRIWFSLKFPKMGLNGSISRKSLIKSRNQNIFEKFKLNRNFQRIPFKMMFNTSMLRHRF